MHRYMILPLPGKVRIERRSSCSRVLTQSRENWEHRRLALAYPPQFYSLEPSLLRAMWTGTYFLSSARGKTAHYHAWRYRLRFRAFSQLPRVSRFSLFLILFLPFVSSVSLLYGARYCTSYCLLVKLVKPASGTFILM